MARQQVGYDPGAEALRPTVSPNYQMVQAEGVESRLNGNKGYQLAEALGSASAYYQKWKADDEAKRAEADRLKLPTLVEKVKQEIGEGVATAEQIGKVLPGSSHITAARIADAMGSQQGEIAAREQLEYIMQNDELKLDSNKRKEYLDNARENILKSVMNSGNDYYTAGYLSTFDKMRDQYENQFVQQTAAYHVSVLENDFKSKITDALRNGGDPLAIDGAFKATSALNDIKRKELAVDAAIELAMDNYDQAGALNYLKAIPDRLLNSELKAKLQKAETSITDIRWSEYARGQQYQEAMKKQEREASQMQILSTLSQGGRVDYKSIKDIETYKFAVDMASKPMVAEDLAMSNKMSIKDNILNASTFGKMNADDLKKMIMTTEGINLKDREELLKELPTLIEGRNLMRDSFYVKNAQEGLEATLKALEGSKSYEKFIKNGSLPPRNFVMDAFNYTIQTRTRAFYETNKRFPSGIEMADIVDAAKKTAEDKYSFYIDPRNAKQFAAEARAQRKEGKTVKPTAAATAPTPAPSTPPPKGKKRVQIGTASNGQPLYQLVDE